MTQRERGYRWLTTEQLRALNERAIETNAHRSLNNEFWEAVDPEGVHVVERSFPYGQSDNGPGQRLLILAKMRDDKGIDETDDGTPCARIMLDVDHGVVSRIAAQGEEPCPPLFGF